MSGSSEEVVAAARALAAHGLVDAFGHVSARDGDRCLLTPPVPLGALAPGAPLVELPLDVDELPPGAPKEAWIHIAIYRARPDVGGICRAQPATVNAAAGAGVILRALHGQGAYVGAQVPLHDDARLVRDAARGEAVARALGGGDAVVMRGNGALAVGEAPGIAMARMHVLEATARVNLAAAAAGTSRPLSDDELTAWRATAPEILGRLWAHLDAAARGG